MGMIGGGKDAFIGAVHRIAYYFVRLGVLDHACHAADSVHRQMVRLI